MKLIFSLTLCFWFCCANAQMIGLYFKLQDESKARMLIKILQEKFYVPSELISLNSNNNPCEENRNLILQFCFDEQGRLQMPWLNKKRYKFSLSHLIALPEINLGESQKGLTGDEK